MEMNEKWNDCPKMKLDATGVSKAGHLQRQAKKTKLY